MERDFFSGVRIIAGAATIILIFAVLLIPEPKFYKHKTCMGLDPEEKCGDNVIEWGPSIAQRLREEYFRKEVKPERIIIPPTSPSITKDWVEFKNKKYGFQFRYPKNIYILNEGEDRFSYVLSMSSDGDLDMIDAFELNLVINKSSDSINNLKFCTDNAGTVKEGPAYNYEGEKLMLRNDLVSIGSQEACMQKMKIDEKMIYNVLLQKENNIYTMQFLTEGSATQTEALTKQILSTFIFTGVN